MTVTLNTVTAPTPAYQPYVPVVSKTSDSALSSQATALSAESAVVASLGGSSGVSVYTPTGLLNSIVQAGTVQEPLQVPTEGSNVDTSQTASQAQDLGVVNTLSSTPEQSGIYTGTGGVAALPSTWVDVLKNQPNLAGNAISASYNAGIINTIA
jgi:hypothetical protein